MLSYTLEGPGDPAPVILYLHGLGIAGWSWAPVHEALPEFGALVPDLPGHGASAGIEWQSIADTAARVAEVVDKLPAERPVHVTGHSLGAYVGWTLLGQRPERFSSALLSGFHIGSPGKSALLKLAYVANSQAFRFPALLKRMSGMLGDTATAARFMEGARLIKPRTIRRAGIQVVDFKPSAGLEAVPVPTTAVAADGEPHSIRSTPTRLAERNAQVRSVILQDRGHLWPVKEPSLYAELLGDHLVASD